MANEMGMERRKLASTVTGKLYECQNCGECWTFEELKPMPERGIFERVAPGEPMPAGECPECGACCHASEATAKSIPQSVTSMASERRGLEWLLSPPVTWDSKTTRSLMSGTAEIQEVENWLSHIAVCAARLSGYLDVRGASGCGDNGHAEGVKSSNEKAAKVRKAIGYTYPKNDINF